jgi:hypothetical protein
VDDIELGLRMRRAGKTIWLCKELQVTHLKRWTLRSLLYADICLRAVPWTRLILRTRNMPDDLNLDPRSRFSAVAAWLGVICLLGGLFNPWVWLGAVGCFFALTFANLDLYRFFVSKGGSDFVLAAFGLHTLYFLYSSVVFGVLFVISIIHRLIGR